jgi:hypothetical protein
MKKLMLLALAVVSAALFALPAVAAAGAPETDCPAGAATCKFTSSGTASSLTTANGTTVNCTANTGSGEYTNKTTGTIALTFTGCKDSIFSSSCSTSGQAAGTIKTNSAVFHNIYTTDNKTTPGVLITQPSSGSFANFACGAGFLTVNVTGNVIGSLETPGCGAEAETWALNFTQTAHGQQTHKQITGTGTSYDLISHLNTTAEPQTSAMVATGSVKFLTGKAKLTCV